MRINKKKGLLASEILWKYRLVFTHTTNPDIEIPEEMFDFIRVLEHGAEKYEPNNWLKPDGHRSRPQQMAASICRHLGDVLDGKTQDKDSGLHPALHAAARLLMMYTRQKKRLD